jgi:uncharacterized protein (DUF58 family)
MKHERARQSLWLVRRWNAWWAARSPRRDQITLNQRNLYILPTRAGWGFTAVFVVLLLASINEQVNLGYALSFLLSGTALSAVYLTHGNLQGVSLRLLTTRSVHAGQVLRVGVVLSNEHRKRGRWGLWITAGPRASEGTTEGPGCPQSIELLPGSDCPVELDVATHQRGWLTLPRITVETRYPLGLLRAWAYWRPQTRVLVWPALESPATPLPDTGRPEQADANRRTTERTAMPDGLRDYRRGDPVRWIAWKKSSHAMASGTGLVSREPSTGHSPDRILDFEHSPDMASLPSEARLSRLASWLLLAEQAFEAGGPLYGLRLPGLELPCDGGTTHLRRCLDALAAWEQAPASAQGAKDRR